MVNPILMFLISALSVSCAAGGVSSDPDTNEESATVSPSPEGIPKDETVLDEIVDDESLTEVETPTATTFASTVPIVIPSFSYAGDKLFFVKGEEKVITLTTSNFAVGTQFRVDPALPQGLTLDTVTGEMKGAATKLWAPRLHTVTAEFGGTNTSISIYVSVVASAQVAAKFTAAQNWLDWYSPTTEAACDAGVDTDCIHGGPLKVVTVPELVECAGLEIVDSLGAFNWGPCFLKDEAIAFYSLGIKAGYGLKDLIKPDSWKENSVVITDADGQMVAVSRDLHWWNNDVTAGPLVAAVVGGDHVHLDDEHSGKILTYSSGSELHIRGFTGGADKLAIVGLGETSFDITEYGRLWSNYGGYDYHWLENIKLRVSDGWGVLRFDGNSRYVTVEGLHCFDCSGLSNIAIYLPNAGGTHYSRFRNIVIEQNSHALGIYARASSYNVFQDIELKDSQMAFRDSSFQGNVIVNLLIRDASTYNFFDRTTYRNTFINTLLANPATSYNLDLDGHYHTFVNTVSIGAATDGIAIGGTTNQLSDTVVVGSADEGLVITGASNRMLGTLKIGNNTTVDCNVTGAGNNVGTSGTGTTNCQAVDAGDEILFALQGGVDLSTSFKNLGTGDMRLVSTDTVLLNGRVSSTDESGCPSPSLDAADTITDQSPSPRTFLRLAVEINGFGGNENGLCEAGETCLFTPNFGIYQGHANGDPLSECTVSGGGLSGITLFANPHNGVP